jgi:hypothetical protein
MSILFPIMLYKLKLYENLKLQKPLSDRVFVLDFLFTFSSRSKSNINILTRLQMINIYMFLDNSII